MKGIVFDTCTAASSAKPDQENTPGRCPPTRCSCQSNSISCQLTPQEEKNSWSWQELCSSAGVFLLGVILFVLALSMNISFFSHRAVQYGISPLQWNFIQFVAFLISYLLVGWPVLYRAVDNILHLRLLDEFFLMTAATLGAFALGFFAEGVAVLLFFRVGEFLQDQAVGKARSFIAANMDLRPEQAWLEKRGKLQQVHPQEVHPGDIVQVRPGERVPLDGKLISGRTFVDTSALTGESRPRRKEPGDELFAGMINQESLIRLQVKKDFQNSAVSRILSLVENSARHKATTEQFITKFAKVYTPLIVLSAILVAFMPFCWSLLSAGLWSTQMTIDVPVVPWIYRALIFLVISCPCALVISIPLVFFAGIGAASRKGVVIKGGRFLEALAQLRQVVWDKTGTLTRGVFQVHKLLPAPGVSEKELLYWAAQAEAPSSHPIARSIVSACSDSLLPVQMFTNYPGQGVMARVRGEEIRVGCWTYIKKYLPHSESLLEHTTGLDNNSQILGSRVHVLKGNTYLGAIVIGDLVRNDARRAVCQLKRSGVFRQVILSGDQEDVACRVALSLGIDQCHGELLPADKIQKLEKLMEEMKVQGKTAFVGDGLNDAPVLARADVGVAMGGVGSDAAVEAADMVLLKDKPSKLVTGIRIARITRRLAWQNIVLVMGVKTLVLLLGVLGMATMWEGVFADVGVALLALFNACRVYPLSKEEE